MVVEEDIHRVFLEQVLPQVEEVHRVQVVLVQFQEHNLQVPMDSKHKEEGEERD